MENNLGAIILAGGRGKRMQSTDKNKVTMHLSGKPIISHIVSFLKSAGIKDIVVVVGFAKESVATALSSDEIIYAHQEEQLGTGHAVQVALPSLPFNVTDVLVVYGDDGVLYNENQRHFIDKLFEKHFSTNSVCTFLTIEQVNPQGLGRVVRNSEGKVKSIVEEKDATEEQKNIQEINPGCFVFSVAFLHKYIPLVEKSPVTNEYYLTSLIDLALKNGEKVETLQGGKLLWRGVNTPEELQEAEKLYTGT